MNEPKEVEPEYFIKLLLLGDISVGKSSFIYRFIYDKFNPVEMPSSKLDLQSSDIIVSKNKIRVQLWDTVGQEKFRSITQSLISKMQGIVIMFDLTNKETYDNIKIWIELIREQSKKLPIIIIGNKCDLEEERIIQKEEAKGYYKKQKSENDYLKIINEDKDLGNKDIKEDVEPGVDDNFNLISQNNNIDDLEKDIKQKMEAIINKGKEIEKIYDIKEILKKYLTFYVYSNYLLYFLYNLY